MVTFHDGEDPYNDKPPRGGGGGGGREGAGSGTRRGELGMSLANIDQTHVRRDFQTSENIETLASLDFDRTINSYSIHGIRAKALMMNTKKENKVVGDDETNSKKNGDHKRAGETDTSDRGGLPFANEETSLIPQDNKKGHRKGQSSMNSIMVDLFSDDDPFLHTKKTKARDKKRQSIKPFMTFDSNKELLATLSEDSATSTLSMTSTESGMSGGEGGGKHLRVKRNLKISTLGHKVAKWIFTCLVGLLVGLAAIAIVDGVGRISNFRTKHLNDRFAIVYGYRNSSNPSHLNSTFHPTSLFGLFGAFAFFSFVPAFLSGLMCVYMAPGASGSGIPEVKAYLNGVRVKSFAQFNLLFVKIVGTILSVSSGLAIGPEGPLVHIGAIIGASVTKTNWILTAITKFGKSHPCLSPFLGCGSTVKAAGVALRRLEAQRQGTEGPGEQPWETSKLSAALYSASRIFSRFFFSASMFRYDSERRDFITIGSAAGFAAAFGAPVGGVLYGLEETSTFFATTLLWKTLNATAIATFCIAVYHGGLDKFSVLTLHVNEEEGDLVLNRFEHLPYYVMVGLVGGLLGALFNSTILYVSERRKDFYANTQRSTSNKEKCRLLEVTVLSVFTSIVIFFLPLLLPHACSPITEPNEQTVWQMNCQPGNYNEVAKILLGTRDDAILEILTSTEEYNPNNLLAVGLAFFLLQIVTFGVSLPSGIFMPTILTGASLGGYMGLWLQHYDPSISPSVFALLGAAGLLSGMQRTTVSLCVILMEGTGQTKVLIPVIITVVVACYVGNLFNHGIYEVVMELKEFPYLEPEENNPVYDMFSISNVMSAPVVVVNSIELAGTIESLLIETTHNGFPVVDHKTKQFIGLVRRDQLVALLESGVFMKPSTSGGNRSQTAFRNSTTTIRNSSSTSGAPVHRGIFHDNSVSISFVERNPQLVTTALQIRDDRYGSVMGQTTCLERLCPSVCCGGASSQITLFSALAPQTRKTIEHEHEWLAETIDTVKAVDDTLPRKKTFQSTRDGDRNDDDDNDNDDNDDPTEQPIVDVDVNRNVIIHLPNNVRTREVNIEAIMNRGAHVVLEGCPLSKAYELFTKMGLRHLTVLGGSDKGKVVGIVTRYNLMTEHIEKATGFKLH